MDQDKNVSKGVSNKEDKSYEELLVKIKNLIPGQRAFNNKVANKIIKSREKEGRSIEFDSALALVSLVRNGHKKDWETLRLMYEQVKPTEEWIKEASKTLSKEKETTV